MLLLFARLRQYQSSLSRERFLTAVLVLLLRSYELVLLSSLCGLLIFYDTRRKAPTKGTDETMLRSVTRHREKRESCQLMHDPHRSLSIFDRWKMANALTAARVLNTCLSEGVKVNFD